MSNTLCFTCKYIYQIAPILLDPRNQTQNERRLGLNYAMFIWTDFVLN